MTKGKPAVVFLAVEYRHRWPPPRTGEQSEGVIPRIFHDACIGGKKQSAPQARYTRLVCDGQRKWFPGAPDKIVPDNMIGKAHIKMALKNIEGRFESSGDEGWPNE
jgi:hypothetical protein